MDVAGGIVGEYQQLRAETDADVLAMQVGDFYEFFGETAELVHEVLDLKLTSKPSGGERYAMAGVPVSEIERYAQALVERGYRVAIADQDDGSPDHDRSIARVITPGTTLQRSLGESGYLVAVTRTDGLAGLALVDVATGRCFVDRPHDVGTVDDLREILAGLAVSEVLAEADLEGIDTLEDAIDGVVTVLDPEAFDARRADRRVRERFGEAVIDTLDLDAVTTRSLGAILAYLDRTDPSLASALSRLERYRSDDAVALDATTQRNLELTETFTGERQGSLLTTIDHTVTAAGARLLEEWLRRPTRDTARLERRLEAVAALDATPLGREAVRDHLGETYDIDRVLTRVTHGSATPRELDMLRETLAVIPQLMATVRDDHELADTVIEAMLAPLEADAVEGTYDLLDERLAESPPGSLDAGGVIRVGWDDELDAVIEHHDRLVEWFDSLADRERRAHGVDRISVGQTKVDGYYLEVPEDELDRVPPTYDRIKTVAAGTRYRTDELVEKERELRELEERRAALEAAAFDDLVAAIAERVDPLREVAIALAGLDVRASIAEHAAGHDWNRPQFREDGVIEIDQGRHPVVETTTRFVPNDCRFDDTHEQVLVTGPNMSGKSTYLRQVALITLLAQIGSFVPADRAAITPVDGIYTRVGALDELAQGRSTFMVEMQELARILHRASEESLVILDEVGRGTATYDGMSIAWAVTEYLHNHIGSRTLFATHYHELTVLTEHLAGVSNLHVAVDEEGDSVVFLRTVRPGAADRSYGIHVAEMAGIPPPVVARADEVLERLRDDRAIEARGRAPGGTQVVFDLDGGYLRPADESDDETATAVAEEIRSLDLTARSPLEVLDRVREWQSRLARPEE